MTIFHLLDFSLIVQGCSNLYCLDNTDGIDLRMPKNVSSKWP